MTSQIKIKFIFVGNKPVKKPSFSGNYLCIYLNKGKSFLIAKENRSFFEFILNFSSKKEQQKYITLLNNNSFYEFVGSVSEIQNYSKLFTNFNKPEKFRIPKQLFDYFDRWSVSDVKEKKLVLDSFSKELKESILRRYMDSLKIKYTKPMVKPKPIKPIKPKIK